MIGCLLPVLTLMLMAAGALMVGRRQAD